MDLTSHNKFRYNLFLGIFASLLALLTAEFMARVFFARDKRGFEIARKLLAGEMQPGAQFQNSIGLPYLLYGPAPNFKDGDNFHNAQGYRGRAVDFNKQPNIARILCLGGSTTYGWGVSNPEAAYPAQLEKILAATSLPGFEGVEVINAGVPWGTSAEMLSHYHYKYHYFKPDVVIINEGGNDGQAAGHANYQPDYSHWRKPLVTAQAWPPLGRLLLKSRFLAWGLILITQGPDPGITALMLPEGIPPPVKWYPTGNSGESASAVLDTELGFLHNIRTLVREVSSDGAIPILVPFRIAPQFLDKLRETEETLRNERLLKQLALEQDLILAPFPAEVIGPNNWVDDCHLNEAGEQQKAAHIAPFVRQALIWDRKQVPK